MKFSQHISFSPLLYFCLGWNPPPFSRAFSGTHFALLSPIKRVAVPQASLRHFSDWKTNLSNLAIYLLRLFWSSLFFHFQFLAEHWHWLLAAPGTSTISDISVLPFLENRWNPSWWRVRTKAHHWHCLHIIRVSFVLQQDLQIISVCFNYFNKTHTVLETRKPLEFSHSEQNLVNECWWLQCLEISFSHTTAGLCA